MSLVASLLQKTLNLSNRANLPQLSNALRYYQYVVKPKIGAGVYGAGVCYRRKVHYPEEYTVKPLEVRRTYLAGRNLKTARIAVGSIGGGIKHKYHWIDWKRVGPSEGPPQEEKVLRVIKESCIQTAHIALVAVGDRLKKNCELKENTKSVIYL